MVFRSIVESQIQPHTDSTKFTTMASSTLKSNQPLHNFSLQDLKWSMNHANNHRFRKLASDSSHKSPHRETAESDSNPGCDVVKTGTSAEKSEKKFGVSDSSADNSDKKSKIFIRIRTKNSKSSDYTANSGDQNQNSVVDDAEETITKTWNLRPRNVVTKAPNGNGGALKIAITVPQAREAQEPSRPELTRSRASNDVKMAEKKDRDKEKEKEKEKQKKLKFSIPLIKEEIEDDIYALTGSKPARRPKKRAKHVQKQLDCVFPGLWLSTITPDMYRVHDPPTKGIQG